MKDPSTNDPSAEQMSLFGFDSGFTDNHQENNQKKPKKTIKAKPPQPRNLDADLDPDFDDTLQDANDHLVNAFLDTIDLPDIITDDELDRISIGCLSHTWDNVVTTITTRLRRKNKKLSRQFQLDYDSTLGWLLGYWSGSISLDMVLLYENNLQKDVYKGDSLAAIKHLLHTHPTLANDCEQLRIKLCGGELFMKENYGDSHPSDIDDPLSHQKCDGRDPDDPFSTSGTLIGNGKASRTSSDADFIAPHSPSN